MSNPKIKYIVKFILVWLIGTVVFLTGIFTVISLSDSSVFTSEDLLIVAMVTPIVMLIFTPIFCVFADTTSSLIGIKKSKLLLTESISKSRKVFIGSCVQSVVKLCPYYFLLFLTEAGIEAYSGKYALKKINFYILWKDVDNISSRGNNLIIKTANGKTQSFIINDNSCSAEMLEEAYIKHQDQIKKAATESL